MSIPFRNKPLFTSGGISFDLGGGEELGVIPDMSDIGGGSRSLWLPPSTANYVLGVDGVDAVRYGGGPVKTGLFIPGHLIGIGDPADLGDHLCIIHRGTITGNRTHTLQNKSGTIAHTEDIGVVDKQYISGFGHVATPTSVIINAGQAYVEYAGKIVEYPGGTYTYPGTIPNNTTINFYLDPSGGVIASAAPPAIPLFGTARYAASPISQRRYLFSVRSANSGNVLLEQRGVAMGNVMDVTYTRNTGLQPLVTAGPSTTPSDVDASGYAPPLVSTDIVVRAYNASTTTGTIRIHCWNGSSFVVFTNIPTVSELFTLSVPCDQTPKFQYDVIGDGRATINLIGYRIQR